MNTPSPEENNIPTVAVIMPAYNQARYIADALNSLLSQTFTHWVCAIVDDGSPDNVEEIVKPFIERDKRFSFHHTHNKGVSAARNYAVDMTRSEFIIPLDADDTFEPGYIEKCVRAFRENPALKVVRCEWRFFGAKKSTPPLPYKGYRDLLIDNSIFCSAMFRRTDFTRCGGYDEEMTLGFEDWEFWIRMLAPAGPEESPTADVFVIPEKLFNYRIKKSSRSTSVEQPQNTLRALTHIYTKHTAIYNRFFPDTMARLHRLSYLEKRLDKWKRRNIFSRLWYALTGRF